MSISANFPNVKPSLLLDFANAQQLPPSVTFTRATTAAYYNGSTTALAEQNLLLYSQAFNSWSNTALTVTADTTTAPDGTTTADTMTATGSVPYVYIGVDAITKVGTYTFSCYVKAGTNNFVALNIQGTANSWVTAVYNLSTGAVTQTGNGSSGLVTITTTSITSVGSSWYRCVLTASSTSTVLVYPAVMFAASATGNTLSSSYGETSGNTVGNTLFVWGAQIEARSTATAYTPTTTAAITNYIPQLLTAGGGQPRFDHNPTTSESLGLLIEEQRTNIVTNSNVFTSGWTYQNMTVTGDTAVAPDGTLTADKAILTAVNNYHSLYQAITYVSGNTYTYSLYAKAGELTQLVLSIDTGFNASGANAIFNLSTGVVTSSSAITTASITAVGNGWYRCAISAPCTGSGATLTYIVPTNSGGAPELGNAWNGAYIWGIQIEVGTCATSYIATTSAAATRAADSAQMTGANFTSWYSQGFGTLYAEYAHLQDTGASTVTTPVEMNDGTQNKFFQSGPYTYASNTANVFTRNASSLGANSTTALISRNGSTLGPYTDSAVSIGGLTLLVLGIGRIYYPFPVRIKKVSYYPIVATQAQLNALTS